MNKTNVKTGMLNVSTDHPNGFPIYIFCLSSRTYSICEGLSLFCVCYYGSQ